MCLLVPSVQEHGWKEMVFETGFQAKVPEWSSSLNPLVIVFVLKHFPTSPLQADSRLRALNATFRVRSPHK